MVVHAHYNMTDSNVTNSKCTDYCKGAVSVNYFYNLKIFNL